MQSLLVQLFLLLVNRANILMLCRDIFLHWLLLLCTCTCIYNVWWNNTCMYDHETLLPPLETGGEAWAVTSRAAAGKGTHPAVSAPPISHITRSDARQYAWRCTGHWSRGEWCRDSWCERYSHICTFAILSDWNRNTFSPHCYSKMKWSAGCTITYVTLHNAHHWIRWLTGDFDALMGRV